MAHSSLPKDEVVERLAGVFRREGYGGASLARLSEASGLGRSSLYHHFPRGKEDMAEAVLEAINLRFAREVMAPLREPAPARRRLEAMASGLAGFYDDGTLSCLTELFGIGETGARFRERLSSRIDHFIQIVSDALIAEGVPPAPARRRAEDALIAVHGALVLSRAAGSPDLFQRIVAELPDRLLE